MQPPCLKEVTQVCFHGCCPSQLLGLPEEQPPISKSRSTSSTCRRNFAVTTTSSFFPNTQFTDHESLPLLQESLSQFKNAYPQYLETIQVDQIRAQEYYHLSLSNHICLDYIGIGLFSHTQFQNQHSSILPIASCSSPPPEYSKFPFFGISHKSVNLKSQLLHGGQGSELESTIKKKIMNFLNISENDYCMVFTANRSSAFELLAKSYPFQASRKLLTVYDYESEAVETMINSSEKRGARVMSAEFTWPRLRIHSGKLKKMIVRKRKKKKIRGLFMFPLQSRVTGASYSYQWMSMAQENGWHVLLDACALGPKDMNSFGLSLIRPDFLVCSFYKVFGENPTGFGCLFVKKSTVPVLEASTSMGIVNLVPAKKLFCLPEDSSGPISVQSIQNGRSEHVDATQMHESEATTEHQGTEHSSQLVQQGKKGKHSRNCSSEIECRGLDHVDSLGLILISNRSRFLINWLINALMKLQHPNADERIRLVRIYGPRIKFDRGPALAFNVYDWKGERVEPTLVQKLADRSNISLSYGSLHHIWFSDKYQEERERVIEKKKNREKERDGNRRTKANHVTVVTVALGFLANFEDIYRLWAFVAQFLDADFVEKERWRYTALNQKIVEVIL
ncbi:uncharacterized protein LOC130764087 isoform X2 [Actinidia eriantha]|uniref:uncharacterized protein LOC130764087 isoform X2 n=1 Tax=Actinidia eriantha TaxID=165200 RepID=UPI0025836167|nr:uncharacterized protein LOC130764087 isoform X2 [Actinidia eriantha]